MSGLNDKVKGRIKEKVGKVTGDKDLETKGKLDKAAGSVKEQAGRAKDWVEDKVDDVRDRADRND